MYATCEHVHIFVVLQHEGESLHPTGSILAAAASGAAVSAIATAPDLAAKPTLLILTQQPTHHDISNKAPPTNSPARF